MIIFDYLGQALTHQKIIPGDTATSIDAQCYKYYEYTLLANGVDSGSTEVAVGRWIYGGTSYARAVIVSYTLDDGSWGASSARVTLRLRSVSGTFSTTENIAYGSNSNHLTVRSGETQKLVIGDYVFKGANAKAMLINIYANTALCTWDGSTPDQTLLIGQPLISASSYILTDPNDIRNFKCIDYASGFASNVQLTLYF
jgi:hypothetical protein